MTDTTMLIAAAQADAKALLAECGRLQVELAEAHRALAPLDAVVHALGIEDSPDDPAECVKRLQARVEDLENALEFYADPETYLAIGFFPDPPCGEFMEDWSDTGEEWGLRPGKRARAALQQEQG